MEKQQIDYAELERERVISIADLFREIVYKLWLIILMAVIFAVVAGGYKYVKDLKTNDIPAEVADAAALEADMSESQRQQIYNALRVQESMIQQQEYLDNSVLVQIDPYNESKVSLQYYLICDGDYQRDLLSAYDDYVSNGALATDLQANHVEWDTVYLNELVSYDGYEEKTSVGELQSSKSFEVKVIHANADACQEIANAIKTCLESYRSELSSVVGEHQLVLVNQSGSQVIDKSLWNYSVDRITNLKTTKDSLKALKEEFNDDQLVVFQYYSAQVTGEDVQEISEIEAVNVSINKKYVALGAIVGIILAVIFILLHYFAGGVVNTVSDLEGMYNLCILGNLQISKRNIWISIWDRLTGKRKFAPEEEYSLLMLKIRNFCEKGEIKKLLISGSSGLQMECEWISKLVSDLKKSGVESEITGDVLRSSEAVDKLSEFEHIVFVEKMRSSRFTDIAQEMKSCMEQRIQIEGVIVLN